MSASDQGTRSGSAKADDGSPLTRLSRVERQAGALAWLPGDPWRLVLVTSRRTQRWVFPKGGIEAGQSAAETAAREALEEAGVVGRAEEQPVGRFRCDKVRPPHVWTLEVDIYPVAIDEVREHWREAAQRERRFVTAEEASSLLGDADMLAIVERFAAGR